jgi:hypothetical protein
MRGVRSGGVAALVALGVVASTRLTLVAQEREPIGNPEIKAERGAQSPRAAEETRVSVVEAMERPFILPFGEPTRLDEVCRHLRRILNAPVALDRAALERQEVEPDDTVEIELHGVRLKTGLKLLLDQLGLTYKVVPEDNLLVITDDQGSEDPLHRLFAELKALHRDIHDVQDSVEEIRTALGLGEEGPKMHKPTIIEEMPEQPEKKSKAPPLQPPVTRPRSG